MAGIECLDDLPVEPLSLEKQNEALRKRNEILQQQLDQLWALVHDIGGSKELVEEFLRAKLKLSRTLDFLSDVLVVAGDLDRSIFPLCSRDSVVWKIRKAATGLSRREYAEEFMKTL